MAAQARRESEHPHDVYTDAGQFPLGREFVRASGMAGLEHVVHLRCDRDVAGDRAGAGRIL